MKLKNKDEMRKSNIKLDEQEEHTYIHPQVNCGCACCQ
jgi:hypothetical protein